ncbi:alanine racemase [Bacillus sp. FJAT-50079]|uniref:alanine racemase n=1 Tax=Bacillus sp. FJAT-50079 TaxID=2833577 RepID=UPI001BC90AD4|nr:alanine racemase [Bacillus sp. FJAT-50079]MBS4206476.1 alanine racemase [Bacillus sp. FJAT-50079]
MKNFYRDTWAEINLDGIYENMTAIRATVPKETRVFAAVKANAYGHGDIEVAKTALKAGAYGLVVALLDEALALRESGVTAPILVLGATRSADAGLAAKKNISLTVFQAEWLEQAENTIEKGERLSVHIKCDTGMGRIGIREINELLKLEEMLDQSPRFTFDGIFTHFATADQIDEQYYKYQLETFKEMLRSLRHKPPFIHAANSAAALCHNDSIFNAVRIGIALYGLSPSEEMKSFIPHALREAFSLHTKIVHVKKLKAGDSVGYGSSYTAESDEWIATIPIGYADGWIRRLSGQEVLVDGERVPIVGKICMDQTMIRLSRHMPLGTTVTLIGKQQDQFISVDEIAKKLDTINYEVTCTITGRVPRVYINKKK